MKNKGYYFGIGLLILSTITGLAYLSQGQTIDSNGFLQEPFYLIPLSYIFSFLGILIILITYFRKRSKKS